MEKPTVLRAAGDHIPENTDVFLILRAITDERNAFRISPPIVLIKPMERTFMRGIPLPGIQKLTIR